MKHKLPAIALYMTELITKKGKNPKRVVPMPYNSNKWLPFFLTLLVIATKAANLHTIAPDGTNIAFQHGTFEMPVLSPSPGYQYQPTAPVKSWMYSAGAGLSRNGTAFTSHNPSAPQGSQVLFLQGICSASLPITFSAGYYTINFFAAQRGGFSNTQTIELRIDGVLAQSFTPAGTYYQNYSIVAFYISSGTHILELRGTNPMNGDNTAFIDDLKIVRVKYLPISGFESPGIPVSPGYVYAPPGGPWNFTSGSGLARNLSHFTITNPPAPEGSQVLFLQGFSSAVHNLYIPVAGYYRFHFKVALRGNNPSQPATKNVHIRVANINIGEFQVNGSDYAEKTSLALYLTAGMQSIGLFGVDPIAGDHTCLIDDLRMELLHDWQDPYTWGGTIPGANDNATVSAASSVCLRGNVNVKSITVKGELLGVQNMDVSVNTKHIMVMGTGSKLEFGQDLNPYTASAIFTLNATNTDPDVMGMGNKFIGAMSNGTIHLHGQNKTSWTQLGANAGIGSTSITLKEDVKWQIGDVIVIVSSRPDWNEAEKRTITGISSGGKILNLNAPLLFPHNGSVKSYNSATNNWTADLRAQVGLISHNIKVQGDAASAVNGFGGHMMIMDSSMAYISGIELYNMGQKSKLGRYPFHWHMLGNVGAGQYFKNSSIHQSYNRAITIHGTESTTVENNFFYDHIGHGVFLEDGSERFNVIRKNVTLLTKRPLLNEQVTPSDNQFNQLQNRTPSCYWITNPQNTFEDNVAAGTEGTGFWLIFPQKPIGLSANDPRFSDIEPCKLPLTSFKGNSAHSCMNGFDIFDRLGNTHTIEPNLGWEDTSVHLIENCTWYSNNLALYSGLGIYGPTDNLIFRNNIFVENVVSNMFASYCIVDRSVYIANSGENLLSGMRYAYRVYDGAGQVHNSHFIGWDAPNANLLINNGASIKHTNHIFTGNTCSPATSINCALDNYNIKPPFYSDANDPGHPRFWSVVIRDLTGGISGKANTSIVSNHPFLLTGDEYRPNNWTNVYRSDHKFVLSRLSYANSVMINPELIPNVVCTRTKTGSIPVSVYYIKGFKEWHQLPFLVNEEYEYIYTYESLPDEKYILMTMADAANGDNYIARFRDFGKLDGLNISSSQANFSNYPSVSKLRAASSSGYYIDPSGDLYIKAVATSNAKEHYYNISWTSTFTPPLIDSDGDGMSDGSEIETSRNAQNAGDLAAEFNNTNNYEGWKDAISINNYTVSGGLLSGTGSGNGNAMILNHSYNFKASQVPHLYMNMKASQNNLVRLFFATNKYPGFSVNRVITTMYTGNNAFQTLMFFTKNHPDWNDTITDLRIDPVTGIGTSFQINWIRAGCQENDNDADGVCDFADYSINCNNQLFGEPCNDGNPATLNDTWSADCVCNSGVYKIASGIVNERYSDNSVVLYPNPFTAILGIHLNKAGIFHNIQLFDLQGRLLCETTIEPHTHEIRWNLQSLQLEQGIYVVRLNGANEKLQLKLIKQQ